MVILKITPIPHTSSVLLVPKNRKILGIFWKYIIYVILQLIFCLVIFCVFFAKPLPLVNLTWSMDVPNWLLLIFQDTSILNLQFVPSFFPLTFSILSKNKTNGFIHIWYRRWPFFKCFDTNSCIFILYFLGIGELLSRNVPLSRTVQRPGEFVLVCPRAYTSSLCTGYAVSESVYYATTDWLEGAQQDFKVNH